MFIKLEDLDVYKLAEELADEIWEEVIRWEHFAKDTVGKQVVRSADSISANISEGYGGYSFKENVQFCYYARGSILETKNWMRRAVNRKLLTSEKRETFEAKLELMGKMLNGYINSIKKQYVKKNTRHSD